MNLLVHVLFGIDEKKKQPKHSICGGFLSAGDKITNKKLSIAFFSHFEPNGRVSTIERFKG